MLSSIRFTKGNWFWMLLVVCGICFFLCGGIDGLNKAAASTATENVESAGAHTGSDEEHGAGHSNPVTPVLAALFIILLAAKAGGELMERFQQPAVLGELLFGLIIGNLGLLGFHSFDFLKGYGIIEIMAEIGVILLLFEVGLESNLKEMISVGLSSLLVALVGVITPFIMGVGISWFFFPDESMYMHIYLATVLVATSVGITARVLADMGKLQTKEAKVILGAAVIDDVMGLIVLAVVIGLINAASASAGGGAGEANVLMQVVTITGKAVLFFVGAIIIGLFVAPKLFQFASYLRVRGMLLTTALLICFLFAWAAEKIGLAAIVGAFAAGITLEDVHYKDFTSRGEGSLEHLLKPLSGFLVPIFFVNMGLNVDLSAFGNTSIILFAIVLTLTAIIGKQTCSLGVLEKDADRFTIGLGMIPRGEVGLIVAGMGISLMYNGEPVVSQGVFGAAVIMVIITTMMTPPLLKMRMQRVDKKRQEQAV